MYFINLWSKYYHKFHSINGETKVWGVQQFVQGYSASKEQSWDFNPQSLDLLIVDCYVEVCIRNVTIGLLIFLYR